MRTHLLITGLLPAVLCLNDHPAAAAVFSGPFVSDERLAALRPADPDGYRTYAEELSAEREDPAAHADGDSPLPDCLPPRSAGGWGHSCVLSIIPSVQPAGGTTVSARWPILLDPTHDAAVLQVSPKCRRRSPCGLDPRRRNRCQPLRALRQGNPRDALALVRRYKLQERLPLLTDTITYEEFEQACAPTCPAVHPGDGNRSPRAGATSS